MEQILKELESNISKSIEFFKKEISVLRTSQANPALIENILIDSYGQKMPLKQVASLSVSGINTLIIQPWDKNLIESIAKSPNFLKLGYNPIVDQSFIKIIIPPLTQERRKELIKLLHQKAENLKIAIRMHRENILKDLKKIERGISEDEKFKIKNQIQKIIDDSNKKIKEIIEKKEKELNQ